MGKTSKTKECPECGKICNLQGWKNHIRLQHKQQLVLRVVNGLDDSKRALRKSVDTPQSTPCCKSITNKSGPLLKNKTTFMHPGNNIQVAEKDNAVRSEEIEVRKLRIRLGVYGALIECPYCGINHSFGVSDSINHCTRKWLLETHLRYNHKISEYLITLYVLNYSKILSDPLFFIYDRKGEFYQVSGHF